MCDTFPILLVQSQTHTAAPGSLSQGIGTASLGIQNSVLGDNPMHLPYSTPAVGPGRCPQPDMAIVW